MGPHPLTPTPHILYPTEVQIGARAHWGIVLRAFGDSCSARRVNCDYCNDVNMLQLSVFLHITPHLSSIVGFFF